MNRSTLAKALLLALLVGLLIWIVQRNTGGRAATAGAPAAAHRQEAPAETQSSSGFTVISSRPLPNPGKAPSDELTATARQHLAAGGREGNCGPYSSLGEIVDSGLLASCEAIGATLDDRYRERFGVAPLGQPASLILLFGSRQGYRSFAEQQGMSSAGYAGFSMPSKGYTAAWAEADRHLDFSRTLAHELTHLVNRRALGGNLPRWLSEGLADAIGDTATESGIQALVGLRGAEGEAERLRHGLESGQAGSLLDLVSQQDYDFDTGGASYDYEQSALFVRYLLLDPDLAPRFRGFLKQLSNGGEASPDKLRESLELEWMELDQGFETWLNAPRR